MKVQDELDELRTVLTKSLFEDGAEEHVYSGAWQAVHGVKKTPKNL